MAISVDDPETSARLARRRDLGFALLSDPDLRTIRTYGVEDVGNDIAKPTTVVVDPSGTIRWIYVGDDKRDRPLPDAIIAALTDD